MKAQKPQTLAMVAHRLMGENTPVQRCLLRLVAAAEVAQGQARLELERHRTRVESLWEEAEVNSKGEEARRKHYNRLKPGIWPIVVGGKLEKDHHYVHYNINGKL